MEKHGSAPTGQRHTDEKTFDIWAAGYLDGEGCFTFNSTPRVNVSNTYPWGLLVLRQHYGGSVAVKRDKRKKSRPQFEWNVYGEKALACLERVLPYLFEKRTQAEIIRSARSYPAQSAARRDLIAQLKTLKRIRYE